MPTFHYKAKDESAQTVSGTIEAMNSDEAVEFISQRGLLPITISEGSEVFFSASKLRAKTIKSRQLYLFSRQLANLINAGIPILRALSLIKEQTQDEYFKHVLSAIHGRIKDGKTFSECLCEYPLIFNPLYIAMIRVGEEGGRVKEMLVRISEHLKAQEEIISKVRSALAYPVLMALVGVGTVFFILTFVMPRITQLFSNLNTELPLLTRVLMNISDFLKDGWIVICIIILAITLFIKRWNKTQKGKLAVSQVKLHIPFLKDFVLKTELSSFCRTLALLLKSGISLLQALEITIPTLNNGSIQQSLSQCRKDLEVGCSFSESLKKIKLIPRMMVNIINVGEESGLLEGTLEEIADSYDQETKETIKTMTTLLEPLMILAVGLVIGAIVIAMLLPIFQMDILAQ